MDNESVLEMFDGELFGRLIEKVMVTSLVEVTFVFNKLLYKLSVPRT